MKIDYVDVKNITELELHIYVLGCYPIGESILSVVWDKAEKRVLKSILFDCYEQDGINQMLPVLDKYGLKTRKLDFVIWTHPDEDHSVGFEQILKEYTSNKTIALLPEGVTKKIFDLSLFGIKRLFKVLRKDNLFKKLVVERVSCSKNRTYPDEYGATKYIDGVRDNLRFGLEVYTPFSHQVFQKTEINKSFIKNDLSLSVLLRFDDYGFFFGGDAENQSIKEVEPSSWENVVFVKIPHHGSKSSNKLPEILEENVDWDRTGRITAVSTSFVQGCSFLPEKTVLEKYKVISDNVLLTENDTHREKYGIWYCNYAIRPFIVREPLPTADASVWYKRPKRINRKKQ